VRPTKRQIAAMDNQVGRMLFQIPKNRLQCAPVPMNIGNDCNSHELN
jgi:hypothetical protein